MADSVLHYETAWHKMINMFKVENSREKYFAANIVQCCQQYCSMLSAILFSIVTPGSGSTSMLFLLTLNRLIILPYSSKLAVSISLISFQLSIVKMASLPPRNRNYQRTQCRRLARLQNSRPHRICPGRAW